MSAFLFGVLLGAFIMSFVADYREDRGQKVISEVVILVSAALLAILDFADGDTLGGILFTLVAVLAAFVLYLMRGAKQEV